MLGPDAPDASAAVVPRRRFARDDCSHASASSIIDRRFETASGPRIPSPNARNAADSSSGADGSNTTSTDEKLGRLSGLAEPLSPIHGWNDRRSSCPRVGCVRSGTCGSWVCG